MPLSIEDVQPLLVLQQIDLEIRQKQKQLDALPQRAQIAEARRKRAQIQEKGEQVSALRANVERELEHQRFEDAQLAEKQEQTQEKITSESGDYRAVEALTQELEGFAQRRTALAEKIGGLKTRKAQVDQVAAQVDAALAAINAQEQKAVESFQQEGGALTEAIARAQAAREDLAGKVDADILARYEKTAQRLAGVGIARLEGQRCTACRNTIEDNRMPQIRREAPLSACPHCGRLLVVG